MFQLSLLNLTGLVYFLFQFPTVSRISLVIFSLRIANLIKDLPKINKKSIYFDIYDSYATIQQNYVNFQILNCSKIIIFNPNVKNYNKPEVVDTKHPPGEKYKQVATFVVSIDTAMYLTYAYTLAS